MMNQTSALKYILLVSSFLVINTTPVTAQITPDNTLGAESSRVVPNGAIDKIIDGGALRSRNLFHSFKEFNINNSQSVYFSNPSGIENILTRVTGGNASNILGTLGVNGAANLFLINPNGILFGENARLDVQGSFVGSTADAIKLENGTFFSAVNNQETPLLTISVPMGLQIGTDPGKITVKGNGHNLTYNLSPETRNDATIRVDSPGLQTQPEKTLALVGGDIALVGGNLRADSGRIELGSVAQPGLVSLSENNSGFTLGYSGIENFGNIQLSQKASVDVSGEVGGSIQVQSKRLSIKDGSSILSITSGEKSGGEFIVNATESVELIGESVDGKYASSLLTESQGTGTSGNLTINTGKLTATDGAYLSTYIVSSGNGGNLTVKATDSIELLGRGIYESGLYTGTSFGSSGNAGELTVETGNLTVKNSATVFANSAGLGNGGDVLIEAFDGVTVSDASIVSDAGKGGDIQIATKSLSVNNRARISANSVGQGDAGKISITAGELLLTNGGNISTINIGQGDGGNIFLDVRDTISFDGVANSGLPGGVQTFASNGNSGNVDVKTGSLFLTNSARISTVGFGEENSNNIANAGDIKIDARDTIKLDGANTALISELLSGTGEGGDIQITTGSLSVTDGASILASTSGAGDAGNININARDTVTFDGIGTNNFFSSANSVVASNAVGNGGDIAINTKKLFVTNGALLNTFSGGQGNAGNVFINAIDSITFDSVGSRGIPSGIQTFTSNNGDAGEIQLTTGLLSVTNGARLSTFTNGQGDAGKIKINASEQIIFDGVGSNNRSSGAFSTVESNGVGNAGDIELTTGTLSVSNGAQIKASTNGQGDSGKIEINASKSVNLSGVNSIGLASEIRTSSGTEASGNPGDINVTTNKFRITDSALVSTSTGNNIEAGNININANDFEALNGGRVLAVTFGSGDAGTINLNVKDKITLSGRQEDVPSGLLAITSAESTGKGGSIFIDPRLVIIEDGAGVSVASLGKEDAGDIFLEAGTLQLDNGFINAETASTQGGNINLQISELLLLRNNSQISTNAGTAQAGGDGGNITINSPFIVAVPKENSDITANAYTGKGGNIDIITQGIFGIKPRSKASDFTSDITASSETGIQGEISVTDPDIDPSQGLIELPSGVVDKSNEIAQNCPRGINAQKLSEFYITGRGSLPPSPLNPLEGTVELSRLATLDGEIGRLADGEAGKLENVKSKEIVEAQGFLKTENGEIYLVAQAPTATPSSHANPSACPSYQ